MQPQRRSQKVMSLLSLSVLMSCHLGVWYTFSCFVYDFETLIWNRIICTSFFRSRAPRKRSHNDNSVTLSFPTVLLFVLFIFSSVGLFIATMFTRESTYVCGIRYLYKVRCITLVKSFLLHYNIYIIIYFLLNCLLLDRCSYFSDFFVFLNV